MGCGVGAETLGGCVKLAQDGAKLRLDAAGFRGSELRRDDESLQALQRVADGLQAPLAVQGEGRGSGT